MTVQTVPYALQNASHSAAVFRQAVSMTYTSGGVGASTELVVTQQGSPNMSVILGAGRAMIAGTSVSPPSGQSFTTQGMYHTLNDAPLTLTISASNPTNPRIDAVYMQVQDSFYSGATNTAVAAVQAGAPAVTPVAPAIPANSILIAYIAVAANATTIVTANISQQSGPAQLIPSPSAGQTKVVPTSVVPVTGTASVTSVGRVAFSGVTKVSVNGSFTAAYEDYIIVINTSVSSAPGNPTIVLRASGSDLTAANYMDASMQIGSATPSYSFTTTATSMIWGRTNGAGHAVSTLSVFSPALARETSILCDGTDTVTGRKDWGGYINAAVADGFTLSWGAQTASGTIDIFGINPK